MRLESAAFENEDFIPEKYSCEGEDINPPLSISEVPEGTKTLALIVDDPDAPVGTFVHWVIWNIPAADEIKENTVPQGAVQGRNDFGKTNYGGPCPPGGTHRYYFKLYALDTGLDLAEGASKEDLLSAMEDHILDQASLMGKFSR